MQYVPIAAAMLTGQTLQVIRYDNIRSLNGLAPGVSVRAGAGGNRASGMTMRGV